MHFSSLLIPVALVLAVTTTITVAGSTSASPQPDGRHSLDFKLLSCPPSVRPKISGTSGSSDLYTSVSSNSIIVPSDFMGSVFLTGEGCGKYGDNCQSVDLTFQPHPNATVKSYINIDAMSGKKFLFPITARFDDSEAKMECKEYSCIDGSRDPDDFIANRIYSSTKGVGVEIVYDCRANTTSTAD